MKKQLEQILGPSAASKVVRVVRRPANYQQTLPGLQCDLVWLADGSPNAGLQHIVQRHESDLKTYSIPKEAIPELFEAAVSVGVFAGHKTSMAQPNSQNCPIFVLRFHGAPIVVAVAVAEVGFDITMYPIRSPKVQKIAKTAGISLTSVQGILTELKLAGR